MGRRLSVRTVAQRTGVSARTVRDDITRGDLRAERTPTGRVVIDEDALATYRTTPEGFVTIEDAHGIFPRCRQTYLRLMRSGALPYVTRFGHRFIARHALERLQAEAVSRTAAAPGPWISVAAAMARADLTRRQVYHHMETGGFRRLPGHRRTVFVLAQDVEKLVMEKKVETKRTRH